MDAKAWIAAIAGFGVLGLGAILIVFGLIAYIKGWQTPAARRRQEEVRVEAERLADDINALAKLVNALKGAPQGMQLIVLGIVLVSIGAGLITGATFL